jgi:hypothetical protein
MSDLTGAVERYINLWNEADGEARTKDIEQIFAADCSYTDPLADVSGRAGIDAVVAAARSQFPGFTFRLATAVDSNHNIARFSWELLPPGADESVVMGSDVAVFDETGKIRSVYGFLDKVPAA